MLLSKYALSDPSDVADRDQDLPRTSRRIGDQSGRSGSIAKGVYTDRNSEPDRSDIGRT